MFRLALVPLLLTLIFAPAPGAFADDDCANCMPKAQEALLHATNPAGNYGKAAAAGETVPVSRLLDEAKKFLDKEVTVEGLVVEVCGKRGCWMELAGDRPYETLKAKVCDGQIVFPLSARGKTARVTGILRGVALDRKQTIAHLHAAAKAKGEPFDLKSVKGNLMIYQLQAIGVTVK